MKDRGTKGLLPIPLKWKAEDFAKEEKNCLQFSSKSSAVCLLPSKKGADAQSCEMKAWFLLLRCTVNALPSKFMNHIWDQADGPSPKS